MSTSIPAETRVQIITHKDKRILFSDFSDIMITKELEYALEVMECESKVMEEGEGKWLILWDFTDSKVTNKFLEAVNEHGARFKDVTEKEAVFGLTKLQMIFLNGYNKIVGASSRAFSSKEDALEYLVK